ncbi:hypothetical protein TrRE_jg13513 [Triparma retinervis]|uniref:Uncharacterized protein n=1 Tax=Triparma retinervis TaxID=2557542 RepID=A0A9W7G3E8_9STRA|nr:hypothetical protein TrRE_jg13513 [Triparma retinervis]
MREYGLDFILTVALGNLVSLEKIFNLTGLVETLFISIATLGDHAKFERYSALGVLRNLMARGAQESEDIRMAILQRPGALQILTNLITNEPFALPLEEGLHVLYSLALAKDGTGKEKLFVFPGLLVGLSKVVGNSYYGDNLRDSAKRARDKIVTHTSTMTEFATLRIENVALRTELAQIRGELSEIKSLLVDLVDDKEGRGKKRKFAN